MAKNPHTQAVLEINRAKSKGARFAWNTDTVVMADLKRKEQKEDGKEIS